MRLLFATTNQGKLKEARQLLSVSNFKLLTVSDFKKLRGVVVEESGETFEDNAFLKAQAYGDLAQVLTIAEDAGLVVDALDGKPGVKSARLGSTADIRNQKLLSMMEGKKDRTAQFVSVFCLYNPKTKETDYFRGEIKGDISTSLRGDQGFDYDYLFIPEGYDQTFAELGSEVKNKISHRHQALEKLKTLMLSLSGE
jgi:XTP/dITP diphosphohydrolase